MAKGEVTFKDWWEEHEKTVMAEMGYGKDSAGLFFYKQGAHRAWTARKLIELGKALESD